MKRTPRATAVRCAALLASIEVSPAESYLVHDPREGAWLICGDQNREHIAYFCRVVNKIDQQILGWAQIIQEPKSPFRTACLSRLPAY
jgi:hypothetical protein